MATSSSTNSSKQCAFCGKADAPLLRQRSSGVETRACDRLCALAIGANTGDADDVAVSARGVRRRHHIAVTDDDSSSSSVSAGRARSKSKSKKQPVTAVSVSPAVDSASHSLVPLQALDAYEQAHPHELFTLRQAL